MVETRGYLKSAETTFSKEEREQIVLRIATDPGGGDVLQGTGGFRKVRVARSGMGKRGGARLIYIVRGEDFPIFLVAVYSKNEKESLTKEQRNQLAKRADEIFAKYRR